MSIRRRHCEPATFSYVRGNTIGDLAIEVELVRRGQGGRRRGRVRLALAEPGAVAPRPSGGKLLRSLPAHTGGSSLHLFHLVGIISTVRKVLEVRPGEVPPQELADFERVLEPVRRVGKIPRLVGPDGTAIELPEGIHELLVSIVEHLRAGNGVTVIPMHAELTTVEAAELLNVSRPYLIKQLETGALPYHMVGTHRRLRLADVLAYRDRIDAPAEDALAAMSEQAEELGLYDE